MRGDLTWHKTSPVNCHRECSWGVVGGDHYPAFVGWNTTIWMGSPTGLPFMFRNCLFCVQRSAGNDSIKPDRECVPSTLRRPLIEENHYERAQEDNKRPCRRVKCDEHRRQGDIWGR